MLIQYESFKNWFVDGILSLLNPLVIGEFYDSKGVKGLLFLFKNNVGWLTGVFVFKYVGVDNSIGLEIICVIDTGVPVLILDRFVP